MTGGARGSGVMRVVFDLDGTLIDSDEALLQPFDALGIPRERVGMGLPVAEECARHGITVDDYVAHYDTSLAAPFADVEEMLALVPEWGIVSNKGGASGRAELERLGWTPRLAMFTEEFNGAKRVEPLLEQLGWDPRDVVFVGDTAYDRECAAAADVRFALAGWNPRAVAVPGDIVLERPPDLVKLL